MPKPTKKVDAAPSGGPGGSGKPQNNSLKYGSGSKDSSREAIAKLLVRNYGTPGKPRQLVDAANKAPETPLPVPSTPVLPKEVPKSDTGTTTPSSNQPIPSGKPNHYTISSTPLTGADPISGVGKDSSELSLIQLKERLTHDLMQNIASADELGRRAIFLEEKQAESDAKIKKVEGDIKKAEEALAISASQMKEALAKHMEEMASKDQKLASLTEEMNKEKEQQFKLGKRQGREEFLQSKEFQLMLKKARQDAVLDLNKSPEFIDLSEAVDHVKTAFSNCLAQLFDRSKPDTIKTESREEAEVWHALGRG